MEWAKRDEWREGQMKAKKLTRRDFIIGASTAGVALGSASLLSGCSILFPGRRRGTGGTGANTDGLGGTDGDARDNRRGGALYVASRWPYSIDPFYLQEMSGIQIAACLFDPLVRYDYQAGRLVGAAAESWMVTGEGTVFTFKLVEGARFHNNTEVTAADFKYCWERIFKPGYSGMVSPNAAYIAMIQGAEELIAGEADEVSGIKVVDKLTLEVTLTFPFHEFLQILAYPAFAPLPSTKVTDELYFVDEEPIGNGLFKMEETGGWQPDALRLARFDGYKGKLALLGKVEFRFFEPDSGQGTGSSSDDGLLEAAYRPGRAMPPIVPLVAGVASPAASPAVLSAASPSSPARRAASSALSGASVAFDRFAPGKRSSGLRLAADGAPMTYEEKAYEEFLFGPLDVAPIPVKEFEDARLQYGESADGHTSTPGNQTLNGLEAYTQFLFVNLAREPLADANVRKALSHAIDREAICRELYFDTRSPATGIVPPDIKGFRDGAWSATAYSVDKAKQALREAGYPEGRGLASITLVVSDDPDERRLFKMIETNLTDVGFTVKTAIATDGSQFWSELRRSAGLALTGWIADFPIMEDFLTPLFASFGNYNQFGYHNTEVDTGIMVARSLASETQRIEAFQEVEDLISADMPVIPLFSMRHSLICSDRVNDLYVAPDGLLNLANAWVTF
jgi:ABC-type transport system substrate-binding protein